MSSLAKVGETDLKWAPRKPTRPPPGLGHRPSRSPAPTPTPRRDHSFRFYPTNFRQRHKDLGKGVGRTDTRFPSCVSNFSRTVLRTFFQVSELQNHRPVQP